MNIRPRPCFAFSSTKKLQHRQDNRVYSQLKAQSVTEKQVLPSRLESRCPWAGRKDRREGSALVKRPYGPRDSSQRMLKPCNPSAGGQGKIFKYINDLLGKRADVA